MKSSAVFGLAVEAFAQRPLFFLYPLKVAFGRLPYVPPPGLLLLPSRERVVGANIDREMHLDGSLT
jgi:hypothetical protein